MSLILKQVTTFVNGPPSTSQYFRDKRSQDNNDKNKTNFHLHRDIDLITNDEAQIDDLLEEKVLIDIETQYLNMHDDLEEIVTDSEEEDDLFGLQRDMMPCYPIRNVLKPAVLKSILYKSAIELSTRKTRRSKSFFSCDIANKRNTKLPRRCNQKTTQQPKKINPSTGSTNPLNMTKYCSETTITPTENKKLDVLNRRHQESTMKSMIKNIEQELENEVGNGYGNLEWCKEHTKLRVNSKKKIENDAEIDDCNITEKKELYSKINNIPTPSWRIIEEYDVHDSSCDVAESVNTYTSDSNDSDSSDDSDSSETSTSTWVPHNMVAEYNFPNQAECTENIEVRLINLQKIHIQAICKSLKSKNLLSCTTQENATCKKIADGDNNSSVGLANISKCDTRSGNEKNTRRNKGSQQDNFSKNNSNISLQNDELSKSCQRELARLQFANAGPKMKTRSRLKSVPLEQLQQSTRLNVLASNVTCATTMKIRRETTDSTPDAKENKQNDLNLYTKQTKVQFVEAPLQDENTIVSIEDYDLEKMDVELSDEYVNNTNLSTSLLHTDSMNPSSHNVHIAVHNGGLEKNSDVDKFAMIRSCASSDNDEIEYP